VFFVGFHAKIVLLSRLTHRVFAMNIRRENVKMVGKLVVVTVGMFGFGYALIPIYKHICEHWHQHPVAVRAPGARQRCRRQGRPRARATRRWTRSRTITVEFDANARGPWDFKPAQRSCRCTPGELTTVMYEFQNVQNRTMAAQAIPSYAPRQAAAHFNKLECFCFNQYTLEPGEKKQWPVVVRDRSQAVQGRDHHHAVVHLLRGGRQDAGRPRPPAAACWRPPEAGS
jgi:cytochrome c oxidase assembly protein subunit 11